MGTKLFSITDETQWLEIRKKYVTSTESAALFGASKWLTPFELWHIKRGNISGDLKDNNFLRFGRLVEAPIVEMVKIEHPDWTVSPMRVFAYDEEYRMGSSFDRIVKLDDGRVGTMEVKSISYAQYKKDFIEHTPDDIEASMQYEIQIQHQLEILDKYDFCLLVVFIADTRTLKYIFRDRDLDVGKSLRAAIKKFWDMEDPPEPDFTMDKGIIAKLAPTANPDNVMDATGNHRISELCAMYRAEKDLEKQSKDNADAFYAELMTLIGDARYCWTHDYKITATDVKPNAGKAITPEMVGQTTGARAGYKKLTITPQKGE